MSSDIDNAAVLQEVGTEAEAWTPAAKSSSLLLNSSSGKVSSLAAVQVPSKVEGIKRRGKRRARCLPAAGLDATPDLRPTGVFSSGDPFKLTRRYSKCLITSL
jgi:hypothetical protein